MFINIGTLIYMGDDFTNLRIAVSKMSKVFSWKQQFIDPTIVEFERLKDIVVLTRIASRHLILFNKGHRVNRRCKNCCYMSEAYIKQIY